MRRTTTPSSSVAGKEAQAAAVFGSGFRSRKNDKNLPVAVGDKSLHAAQEPLPLLVLVCLQFHRLQIGSGIGLGEGHGPRVFTGAELRQILLTLRFVAELGDRIANILEAEDVHERRIRP